jgi:predicted transport protein
VAHSIGNLTLTGYNSELSDRPFREKLSIKGGFRESPLHLNAYLAKLDTWNEQQIIARAQHLADLALQVWPAPRVSEETLATYRQARAKVRVTYSLEDHGALKGPIRPLYEEFAKRVLNLDTGVVDEVRKQYIAFKLSSNFLEVAPLASELKLYLDISPGELDDPSGLGRDVSAVGHWGTGDVEVRLSGVDQLEGVMALVRQAFDLQGEEGADEPEWSRTVSRTLSIKQVVRSCRQPFAR